MTAPDDPLDPARVDRIVDATQRIGEVVRRSGMGSVTVVLGDIRFDFTVAQGAPAPVAAAEVAAAEDVHRVTAPLVGIFYRAANPGAAPFVEAGQRVESGQQLGIVEAMKMMNPVCADRAAVVRAVHVEDMAIVEFDELLFTLEPA